MKETVSGKKQNEKTRGTEIKQNRAGLLSILARHIGALMSVWSYLSLWAALPLASKKERCLMDTSQFCASSRSDACEKCQTEHSEAHLRTFIPSICAAHNTWGGRSLSACELTSFRPLDCKLLATQWGHVSSCRLSLKVPHPSVNAGTSWNEHSKRWNLLSVVLSSFWFICMRFLNVLQLSWLPLLRNKCTNNFLLGLISFLFGELGREAEAQLESQSSFFVLFFLHLFSERVFCHTAH